MHCNFHSIIELNNNKKKMSDSKMLQKKFLFLFSILNGKSFQCIAITSASLYTFNFNLYLHEIWSYFKHLICKLWCQPNFGNTCQRTFPAEKLIIIFLVNVNKKLYKVWCYLKNLHKIVANSWTIKLIL